MIADVDETLAKLLGAEMSKTPGCPIADRGQITFVPPAVAEGVSGGKPRLNVYLHDVRENRGVRESGFRLTRKPGENTVGVRRPPISLDLSYLVTAYAGDDSAAEHRLLSDALTVLLRFEDVPPDYLTGALEEQGITVSVAQPEHPGNADPPALWQALGGRMRTALSVVVTARYNPYETKWTRVVRELTVGVGVGTPPHGPLRPLDLSSTRVGAAGVVLDQAEDHPLLGVTVSADGWDDTAATDPRGFFFLLNLPPGPRTLRFRRTGYHPQEIQTVVPAPGHPEDLEPCVVALRSLDDAERAEETALAAVAALNAPGMAEPGRVYHASLSGLLRREDGRPAAYVPVRAGGKQTTTDADGVYCFFDLPAGTHQVEVDWPGERGRVLLSAPKPNGNGASKPEDAKDAKKEKSARH